MMWFYAILIQCPSSSISVVMSLGICLAGFSFFFQNRGTPTAQSSLLIFFTYKQTSEGRCYVYIFMDYYIRIISQNLLFLMEENFEQKLCMPSLTFQLHFFIFQVCPSLPCILCSLSPLPPSKRQILSWCKLLLCAEVQLYIATRLCKTLVPIKSLKALWCTEICCPGKE